MPHLSPISWLILPFLFWSFYFMFMINYSYSTPMSSKILFTPKLSSLKSQWSWSSI